MSTYTLGKYVVEDELGRGGMGVVYKGTHADTGERVAIKVLPTQLGLDPEFRNRFRREIVTLEQLDHPGIVHIRDKGEQDGALYYAMEYVEGTPLDTLLQKARLTPEKATAIVLQCARALEYAHAAGVIHRDIKPANIMVMPDGRVKLTDFGIAKLADATRMTLTQNILGTVEYMSPEQSSGRFVDPRSDLYSLGVVYYQAVTGHLPVTGSNPTDVVIKLRTRPVEPPVHWAPGLPPRMNALILQLLEKDPEKRLPSVQMLVRELEIIQKQLLEQGRTRQAAGFVAVARARAAWYRNRKGWALAVVAVAAVAWVVMATRPLPPAEYLRRAEAAAASPSVASKQEALRLLSALNEHYPQSREASQGRALEAEVKRFIENRAKARMMFVNAMVFYNRVRKSDNAGELAAASGMFQNIIVLYPDQTQPMKGGKDARDMIREIDAQLARLRAATDTDAPHSDTDAKSNQRGTQ